MKDNLELLASERQKLARLKKELGKKQEYLEATMAYKEVQVAQDNVRIMQEEVSRVEELIRFVVLEEFSSHGNKRPYDGIQVKEFSTITILDEDAAKRWATKNAPSIVTLNKSKFNAAVKALELPFIEKGMEYRVQIASDISQYEKKS